MKSVHFHSITDFLSPIWKDTFDKKFEKDPNLNVNQIILTAIDKQLQTVEDKTIKAKEESFLQTAHDEYLDENGSWFGLERENKNESDKHYEQRIINHVLHARDSIPALKYEIAKYLHAHIRDVHIYEPWQDIFLTNDFASRTNGRAHLFGDYYRPAVINITLDVPFNNGVIDIINWFRPVGVVFLLTEDNSGQGTVWHMPQLTPKDPWDVITHDVGFSRNVINNMLLNEQNPLYGYGPFFLNKSNLNTYDMLAGTSDFGRQYYSYLGAMHALLKTDNNDNVYTMYSHVWPLDPDKYNRITSRNGMPVTVTSRIHNQNLLDDTIDLDNVWRKNNKAFSTGYSYKGRSIVEFDNRYAQLSDYQKHFNLITGQRYRLGIFTRSTLKNGRAVIFAHFSDSQSVPVTQHVSTKWTYHQIIFRYNGGIKNHISIDLATKSPFVGAIQVTSPMIEKATYNEKWTPSRNDLQHEKLDPNSEFIYGFLNFRQYFYNHIENAETVNNKLGGNPTNDQINRYMSDYFNTRVLMISYKPLVKQNINTRLWIHNYNINTWVHYVEHKNVKHADHYYLRFDDLEQLLNSNGVMAIALQVPAFKNNYQINLAQFTFTLGRKEENKAGIQVYGNQNYVWSSINHQVFMDMINHKDNLTWKSQQKRPIRYIRDWIRNVSYGVSNDNGFITNDSATNGDKLINDFVGADTYVPAKNYVSDRVEPSYDDYGNPVKSLSILGIKTDGQYPTNALNNLLRDSIFGDFNRKQWNTTGAVGAKDYRNQIYLNFGQNGSSFNFETDNVRSRGDYILQLDGESLGKNKEFSVNVSLWSNGFEKTFRQRIHLLSHKKTVYNIKFNTFGVFPDHVTFRIVSLNDKALVTFKNISLRLATSLNVDGKHVNKIAPQINYKGQNLMYYDDLEFGQPLNMDDLGESFTDLSRYQNTFADINEPEITFGYLLTHVLNFEPVWSNLESNKYTWDYALKHNWRFTLSTMASDLSDKDLIDNPENMLNWGDLDLPLTFGELKSKNAHWNTDYKNPLDWNSGVSKYNLSKPDWYHYIDNKVDTWQYAKDNNWVFSDGVPFDNREHCITLDLGRVYTNVSDILVQHGSDSLPDAEYDTCLQVSMDGKTWHTLYDNYKGYKNTLDKPYVEPKGRPVAFHNHGYDVENSKYDLGKDINKLANYWYISIQTSHEPIKTLGSLLFGTDSNVAKLYAFNYYRSTQYVSPLVYSYDDLLKNTKQTLLLASEGQAYLNDLPSGHEPIGNNTDFIDYWQYPDNSVDYLPISSKFPKIPSNWNNDITPNGPGNEPIHKDTAFATRGLYLNWKDSRLNTRSSLDFIYKTDNTNQHNHANNPKGLVPTTPSEPKVQPSKHPNLTPRQMYLLNIEKHAYGLFLNRRNDRLNDPHFVISNGVKKVPQWLKALLSEPVKLMGEPVAQNNNRPVPAPKVTPNYKTGQMMLNLSLLNSRALLVPLKRTNKPANSNNKNNHVKKHDNKHNKSHNILPSNNGHHFEDDKNFVTNSRYSRLNTKTHLISFNKQPRVAQNAIHDLFSMKLGKILPLFTASNEDVNKANTRDTLAPHSTNRPPRVNQFLGGTRQIKHRKYMQLDDSLSTTNGLTSLMPYGRIFNKVLPAQSPDVRQPTPHARNVPAGVHIKNFELNNLLSKLNSKSIMVPTDTSGSYKFKHKKPDKPNYPNGPRTIPLVNYHLDSNKFITTNNLLSRLNSKAIILPTAKNGKYKYHKQKPDKPSYPNRAKQIPLVNGHLDANKNFILNNQLSRLNSHTILLPTSETGTYKYHRKKHDKRSLPNHAKYIPMINGKPINAKANFVLNNQLSRLNSHTVLMPVDASGKYRYKHGKKDKIQPNPKPRKIPIYNHQLENYKYFETNDLLSRLNSKTILRPIDKHGNHVVPKHVPDKKKWTKPHVGRKIPIDKDSGKPEHNKFFTTNNLLSRLNSPTILMYVDKYGHHVIKPPKPVKPQPTPKPKPNPNVINNPVIRDKYFVLNRSLLNSKTILTPWKPGPFNPPKYPHQKKNDLVDNSKTRTDKFNQKWRKKARLYKYPYIRTNYKPTTLNGWSVLHDDAKHGIVHHHASRGKLPNGIPVNPFVPYYSQMLLHFNAFAMVKEEYPHLYTHMEKQGITDRNEFMDYILKYDSSMLLTLTVSVLKHKWFVAFWNFHQKRWTNTKASSKGINTDLSLRINQVLNHMDKYGNIYVLILTMDNSKKPNITLSDANLEIDINLDDVDSYQGGMYPHLNYAYNTQRIIRGKGNDSLPLPYTDSSLLGHKVTFSFRMDSDLYGSSFYLQIRNVQSKRYRIDRCHQYFRVTMAIPSSLDISPLQPVIHFVNNKARFRIYGFKAELGVQATPYTPLNPIVKV